MNERIAELERRVAHVEADVAEVELRGAFESSAVVATDGISPTPTPTPSPLVESCDKALATNRTGRTLLPGQVAYVERSDIDYDPAVRNYDPYTVDLETSVQVVRTISVPVFSTTGGNATRYYDPAIPDAQPGDVFVLVGVNVVMSYNDGDISQLGALEFYGLSKVQSDRGDYYLQGEVLPSSGQPVPVSSWQVRQNAADGAVDANHSYGVIYQIRGATAYSEAAPPFGPPQEFDFDGDPVHDLWYYYSLHHDDERPDNQGGGESRGSQVRDTRTGPTAAIDTYAGQSNPTGSLVIKGWSWIGDPTRIIPSQPNRYEDPIDSDFHPRGEHNGRYRAFKGFSAGFADAYHVTSVWAETLEAAGAIDYELHPDDASRYEDAHFALVFHPEPVAQPDFAADPTAHPGGTCDKLIVTARKQSAPLYGSGAEAEGAALRELARDRQRLPVIAAATTADGADGLVVREGITTAWVNLLSLDHRFAGPPPENRTRRRDYDTALGVETGFLGRHWDNALGESAAPERYVVHRPEFLCSATSGPVELLWRSRADLPLRATLDDTEAPRVTIDVTVDVTVASGVATIDRVRFSTGYDSGPGLAAATHEVSLDIDSLELSPAWRRPYPARDSADGTLTTSVDGGGRITIAPGPFWSTQGDGPGVATLSIAEDRLDDDDLPRWNPWLYANGVAGTPGENAAWPEWPALAPTQLVPAGNGAAPPAGYDPYFGRVFGALPGERSRDLRLGLQLCLVYLPGPSGARKSCC
ncbi:MAG: hypothetical protein AAF805_00065 [Planctomycetota bacterium]